MLAGRWHDATKPSKQKASTSALLCKHHHEYSTGCIVNRKGLTVAIRVPTKRRDDSGRTPTNKRALKDVPETLTDVAEEHLSPLCMKADI